MSKADEANLKRILVRKARGDKHVLLTGEWNMDIVVYLGSLRNCLNIKATYLATGEYLDESDQDFQEAA